MGGIDGATWQALGLLLTLGGLGLSWVAWRRRGPASGLRGAAWSLLPLAAGLTGVLRLGWEITDSVASWAARLVLSPVVWLGLVVAMTSVVLFVVSGVLRRRDAPRSSTVTKGRGAQPSALPRTASAPAVQGGATQGGAAQGGAAQGGAAQGGASATDDLADIEELLRKHGIT
jgi:heme exporter protein D